MEAEEREPRKHSHGFWGEAEEDGEDQSRRELVTKPTEHHGGHRENLHDKRAKDTGTRTIETNAEGETGGEERELENKENPIERMRLGRHGDQ